MYFFFRSLPFDVKQIIIDFAAADIWRDNVEECILIHEIADVIEKGVFDDECSDILYSCLPYIRKSHMQKKWYQILQRIGKELIINQYTGGPRSWCYHNTSCALNYVVKDLYHTRVFYNSLYKIEGVDTNTDITI